MRDNTALFQLLASQHGVASRRQLRRLGLTHGHVRSLRRSGAIGVLPGDVVVAAGAPASYRQSAMAASLRSGVAAVSHGTAARLHRLAGFANHDRFDVIGGRGAHLVLDPPVITHYSRGPIYESIVHVGPIPVTSIELTLTLLAPVAGIERTALALIDALRRGTKPQSIAATARAWRGRGRPGPGVVLDLLDALRDGSLVEHRPRRRPRVAAAGDDVGDEVVPAGTAATPLRP